MRVLYVTAEVPYPLTSGYLRHFHFVRGLARDHEITLLSLTRRSAVEPEAVAALGPLVARLAVFGAGDGGRVRRGVRVRGAAQRLRGAVAEHVARGDGEVVLVSGKATAPALQGVDGAPLVVDVCDAASLRLRGELTRTTPARRPVAALRLAAMERVERRLAASTSQLLFASERDRAAVGHGVVVPNGIDTGYWTRRAPLAADPVVAFTGVLAYPPNHDAAVRLVTELMPRVRERIPEARAVVAGRDPRPALRSAAAGRPELRLTGACPDLRPHLEGAAVYCAPLRFSSGIQNKLLEALAMELPVVTTEVAAAGLRVAGEEPPLVVAEDDAGLAAAVVRLLGDPAERARLGAAGRGYVERHFSWARSVALVDAALHAAVEGGRG